MIELKKKYKSGSAIEILQEAILFGDIEGGTQVTQNELASALETSRMPVREALIALEYQGLIERHSNQHVNISCLSDESIYSIFRDMAALEIEVIKRWDNDLALALPNIRDQKKFHEFIYISAGSPLREKILRITAEIYLAFVLDHTDNAGGIDSVFNNLKTAMLKPKNLDIISSAYAVYSELLAKELIRIRKRRMEECSTSDR